MQTKTDRGIRLKTKKIGKGNHPGSAPFFFWAVLAVLTASNFLISFGSFSVPVKLWIFFLGVALPLLFWLQGETPRNPEAVPFHQKEFLPEVPLRVLVFLSLFALFLRFWRIEGLFRWPLGDEAIYNLASLDLSRKWSWLFFYTEGQSPPALVWFDSLFFRFFHSPFLDLWVPSALISCGVVVMGVLAARQFFSKSFAWICGGLLAFSYWPLFMGRLCHSGVMVPLFELVFFYCLGKFLKAGDREKIRWAFASGLAAGLQSFAFVPWPVVSLAGGALILYGVFHSRHSRGKILAWALAGFVLALLPFLNGVLQQGYGQHIGSVAAWSGSFEWKRRFMVALGYFSVLGWGVFRQDGFYIPPQGGFLNPLLTSFFVLGLGQIIRGRSLRLSQWLILAGFLFLAPGLLSLNVEGFRVVQVLPLLVVVAAWGFQPLINATAQNRRITFLLILFLLSAGLDFGRLIHPYLDLEHSPDSFLKTGRSLARYRAYQAIKEMESLKGPGLILAEWDSRADRTLDLATAPFNAAHHPALSPYQAQWLALVTDAHYRPFLAKRFPQGQWHTLDSEDRDLLLVPVTGETRAVFTRWAAADKAFREINWGIDHIHDRDCLETVDRAVREDYPLVQGDPYLESCFWEKVGQFYYYARGHFPEHLRASQLAVQRGYPAAHLYRQRAELLLLSGDPKGAEQAGVKARESEALYPWR